MERDRVCLSDHASARLELWPGSRLIPHNRTAALMGGYVLKMAKLSSVGGDDANAMPLLEQDTFF